MTRPTFAWNLPRNQARRIERRMEWLWILGLLLAALILFLTNLGGLPLRDWDEGTVAQVAKEIWRAPPESQRWLFPTLWESPYLNKPPLIHGLIALAYSLGGVNEWTARFPGAILTAISVPLLYGIGREIFPYLRPAIFSALIYLTLLPVVRHGRLAMLDGSVLCFAMLMIWCASASRRDLRWSLGAGIGFGLICLTKGMMGLLLGTVALAFLAWDTPRLLRSAYLWGGILLGSAPAVAWFAAAWWHYHQEFIGTGIVDQSLQRIWGEVDEHGAPPWYYFMPLLRSFPWLLFSLYGIRLAWENRNWGWAKLVLVWSGIYFFAVSVMVTKLPWYILPIYPALALAGGAKLAEVWHWPSYRSYPRAWTIVLALLTVGAGAASVYFCISEASDHSLVVIISAVALTMAVAAVLVARNDQQFMTILFWGMYVSLLLLVSSSHWLWELNDAYPVKPVAALIQRGTPPGEVVYTSFDYERPSLNFYSDRPVIPATNQELKQRWEQAPSPYLLLDSNTFKQLDLKSGHRLYTLTQDWVLLSKKKIRANEAVK